jgi:hypothetical protein
MDWEARLIGEQALALYLSGGAAPDLRERVAALIAQQQATWPMLREGMAALKEVEYKRLEVRGSEVFAQFNPKRIRSTAARVDAASIRERPCFLCAHHLPPEEKGIAFGSDFVILCNPFPILSHHLSIVSRSHTPQAIRGSFSALLDLAEGLGEEYFALYNGPACGASAPDHLHFQACVREVLPMVREAGSWERRQVSGGPECEVFALSGYRVNLLVARGRERGAVAAWFEQALAQLAAVTGAADREPMLNLVVTFGREGWTVYLFPRARHRPACYDAEGEARLTVSPAAIDLAGVMVVPEADHFARISGRDLERIYAEVTLDDTRFAKLVARSE